MQKPAGEMLPEGMNPLLCRMVKCVGLWLEMRNPPPVLALDEEKLPLDRNASILVKVLPFGLRVRMSQQQLAPALRSR
jgi:hypothetical protein